MTAAETEKDLNGIGGWLAWFLGAMAFWALVQLTKLPEVWTPFTDGTLGMREYVPIIVPMIVLESIGHLLQIAGPVVGIVGAVQRAPWTPRFWGLYLCALVAYAVLDIAGGVQVLASMRLLVDAATLQEVDRNMGEARTQNLRLAVSSLVWMRYWHVSRRVRATFGRGAFEAAGSRASTSEYSPRAAHSATRGRESVDQAAASEGRADARVERPCPMCAEPVLERARFCKHCRQAIEPAEVLT